jgi:hypothetical protein
MIKNSFVSIKCARVKGTLPYEQVVCENLYVGINIQMIIQTTSMF